VIAGGGTCVALCVEDGTMPAVSHLAGYANLHN